MHQMELEGIAEAAYVEARMDPERPHITRLARALLGTDAVLRGPRPVAGPAALFRYGSQWRIAVASSLPVEKALFAIGHELGHYLLARAGYREPDEEASADYLGGALLAPRPAFYAATRALGTNLCALAETFTMTETAVALRVGEVCRKPLAVVAPARVRVRGPVEWVWPDDMTIRRWAHRPRPGLRKVRLRDDPRRVVLEDQRIDSA